MKRVWLVLVACGSSAPPPAPPLSNAVPAAPHDACDGIPGAIDRAVASMKGRDRTLAGMLPKLERVALEACREDHWSAALVTCFDKSRTDKEFQRCEPLFTKVQRDAMSRRMMVVLQTNPQPPPPPPSPPPPPPQP